MFLLIHGNTVVVGFSLVSFYFYHLLFTVTVQYSPIGFFFFFCWKSTPRLVCWCYCGLAFCRTHLSHSMTCILSLNVCTVTLFCAKQSKEHIHPGDIYNGSDRNSYYYYYYFPLFRNWKPLVKFQKHCQSWLFWKFQNLTILSVTFSRELFPTSQ